MSEFCQGGPGPARIEKEVPAPSAAWADDRSPTPIGNDHMQDRSHHPSCEVDPGREHVSADIWIDTQGERREEEESQSAGPYQDEPPDAWVPGSEWTEPEVANETHGRTQAKDEDEVQDLHGCTVRRGLAGMPGIASTRPRTIRGE